MQELEDVCIRMKSNISHCFDLVKGPPMKVKLAKVFVEEKQYSQATKLLDDVIEEDDNYSEAAHYYKCHCIVKELGIQTEQHSRKFLFHLQRAHTLFKKRCDTLSSLAAFISMTARTYEGKKESFLFADDYETQYQLYYKDLVDIIKQTSKRDVTAETF